jgi:hypothetical protein
MSVFGSIMSKIFGGDEAVTRRLRNPMRSLPRPPRRRLQRRRVHPR